MPDHNLLRIQLSNINHGRNKSHRTDKKHLSLRISDSIFGMPFHNCRLGWINKFIWLFQLPKRSWYLLSWRKIIWMKKSSVPTFVCHSFHSFVFLSSVRQHICVTVVASGWGLQGPHRPAALWPCSPNPYFTVARLPPILARASGHKASNCVCRHACMRSCFWITGSSWVLLHGVNNHPNLPAVSPKLHSLISKRRVKIILRLLLHGHVREAVKNILFEITIKSQIGAQQEGIRPPHN